MTEVEKVRELLDKAGIKNIEFNGVFLCNGPNGNVARIANYKDDETMFQLTLDGLTPEQAVGALAASIDRGKEHE